MRKVTIELIQNLSAALTEANRQLEELKVLNHELSEKLAAANVALSVSRKVRDAALTSKGSQFGDGE